MIISCCIALLLVSVPALGEELEDDAVSCYTQAGHKGFCLAPSNCPALFDASSNATQVVEEKSGCAQGEVCCTEQEVQVDPLQQKTTQPPKPAKFEQSANDICGVSAVKQSSRVVGGSPAALGSYPWIAVLGYRMKTCPVTLWTCGGSLINKRYVLTAAHCIRIPPEVKIVLTTVRLGEHDLLNTTEGASPVDYGIENVKVQRQFRYIEKVNDIGLIRLDRDVEFTDKIRPICLPTPQLLRSSLENKYPFVAGWGATKYLGPQSSILLHVQVPVLKNEYCRIPYSQLGYTVTKSHLCAGYLKGKKDSCSGDSGGPLMLPHAGRYYLVGVVGYGHKCAVPGFPGVYTRVSAFYDWIRTNAPDE